MEPQCSLLQWWMDATLQKNVTKWKDFILKLKCERSVLHSDFSTHPVHPVLLGYVFPHLSFFSAQREILRAHIIWKCQHWILLGCDWFNVSNPLSGNEDATHKKHKTPGNVRDTKVDLQLYANDTLEQQTRFDPEWMWCRGLLLCVRS